MTENATSGSKLNMNGKSRCIGNIRNLKEVAVKRKEISEEEVFFRVMRDIQGLDIILSLQTLGCYMLPDKSMFHTINFTELIQKLARRKTMFEELVTQRKFKEIFGLYGYKILNLFFVSIDDFVTENRDFENTMY
jgi:hypothetical protein